MKILVTVSQCVIIDIPEKKLTQANYQYIQQLIAAALDATNEVVVVDAYATDTDTGIKQKELTEEQRNCIIDTIITVQAKAI